MLEKAENHPNEFQRCGESDHPLTPAEIGVDLRGDRLPTSLQELNGI